jgi:hypothetical protein
MCQCVCVRHCVPRDYVCAATLCASAGRLSRRRRLRLRRPFKFFNFKLKFKLVCVTRFTQLRCVFFLSSPCCASIATCMIL